jgi:hypothetical protein
MLHPKHTELIYSDTNELAWRPRIAGTVRSQVRRAIASRASTAPTTKTTVAT